MSAAIINKLMNAIGIGEEEEEFDNIEYNNEEEQITDEYDDSYVKSLY